MILRIFVSSLVAILQLNLNENLFYDFVGVVE